MDCPEWLSLQFENSLLGRSARGERAEEAVDGGRWSSDGVWCVAGGYRVGERVASDARQPSLDVAFQCLHEPWRGRERVLQRVVEYHGASESDCIISERRE